MRIDAEFPGGNILFDRIESGDASDDAAAAAQVYLAQDLRDTEGHWFYWAFRVRGATPGRTATFRFTNGNVIGTRGPAVSTDGGATWRWLGREAVHESTFTYTFSEEACGDEGVRFAVGIPYLEANLHAWLARHEKSPHLETGTLCETPKGRRVEILRAGRLDGQAEFNVYLTARHHACESTPNFSIEGWLDEVLGARELGAWYREHVELKVIPFVDKDGVEDGDQGKNRRPYDHNRDYEGESIYASVRALRTQMPTFFAQRPTFQMDLHGPGLRGKYHEDIYFVGGPDPERWQRLTRFSDLLQGCVRGELPFRTEDNLPYGVSWNTTDAKLNRSCTRWASQQQNVIFSSSVEIPYAAARDVTVSAENARAFGRDLAEATRQYLTSL